MPLRNPVVRQSVASLRAWLRKELLAGEHTDCPVCDHHSKMYRRPIGSTNAYVLLRVVLHFENNHKVSWLHIADFLGDWKRFKGDWVKLQWWGFIEAMPQLPGEPKHGFWRPTEAGIAFALDATEAPRWALVVDNVVIDWSTETCDIFDTFGDHYNYKELINFSYKELTK